MSEREPPSTSFASSTYDPYPPPPRSATTRGYTPITRPNKSTMAATQAIDVGAAQAQQDYELSQTSYAATARPPSAPLSSTFRQHMATARLRWTMATANAHLPTNESQSFIAPPVQHRAVPAKPTRPITAVSSSQNAASAAFSSSAATARPASAFSPRAAAIAAASPLSTNLTHVRSHSATAPYIGEYFYLIIPLPCVTFEVG